MDTGEGKIIEINGEVLRSILENTTISEHFVKQYPNRGGIFEVGEEVELKGSRFRIKKITPKDIVLRVLPKKTK